ncbi:MAG: hypothetical protein DSY37_04815 [Hyperthermus sp.]|nr:MAG: hypothetical protein DSY37_04815 [Hyperthermus sp.]
MPLLTLRSVIFETEKVLETRQHAQPPLLVKDRDSGVEVLLKVLRIRRLGLLVQEAGSPRPYIVWDPLLRLHRIDYARVCRYHTGPPGKPWEHTYCTHIAVGREGYCRSHANSAKALYEKCAQGSESACNQAYELLKGEEFSVYVLDYGGSKVKVGLTQEWRLIWRIAEQPHVAAAKVFTGGLREARGLEKKLGRHRIATEGVAVRVKERMLKAAREVERINSEANRIAKRLASFIAALGFSGTFEAYTILPMNNRPTEIVKAREVGVGELELELLALSDYWAGRMLLETMKSKVTIDKNMLLHRLLDAMVSPRRE